MYYEAGIIYEHLLYVFYESMIVRFWYVWIGNSWQPRLFPCTQQTITKNSIQKEIDIKRSAGGLYVKNHSDRANIQLRDTHFNFNMLQNNLKKITHQNVQAVYRAIMGYSRLMHPQPKPTTDRK